MRAQHIYNTIHKDIYDNKIHRHDIYILIFLKHNKHELKTKYTLYSVQQQAQQADVFVIILYVHVYFYESKNNKISRMAKVWNKSDK